jgi:hypothetical protein
MSSSSFKFYINVLCCHLPIAILSNSGKITKFPNGPAVTDISRKELSVANQTTRYSIF